MFTGLAAEKNWNWAKKYPVIRVSFSDGVLQNRAELDQRILDILRLNREVLGLQLPTGLPERDFVGNFSDLIRQAHRKYRARSEPIHLIGVEFSKASRNIVGFEVESLLA